MSSALLGFLPDAGKLSAPIDGDHEAKRVCNDFWSGGERGDCCHHCNLRLTPSGWDENHLPVPRKLVRNFRMEHHQLAAILIETLGDQAI
jgi:hypothetical protein